jgi:glyoxylase I family protein
VEITGLDHIYISVSDFEKSEQFYDAVMRAFGFKKGKRPIAGSPHAHYFNRHTQYTIRPAMRGDHADPYLPGLHHICFQVPDRGGVQDAYRALSDIGLSPAEPAEYPEYHDDYYAVFFEDPDGIRLEVVARSRYRDEIADRWEDLTVFTNPIAELRDRENRSS